MSGNSHLRRRKKPQQNLKKIKERVITILKYTEYSVQHNKNTLSNSITVGFYVKGPGEPAVNVTKHAWGCCSRWTEESLAPSQSERHMSGAVESRRMNLAVLPVLPGVLLHLECLRGTLPPGPGASGVGHGPCASWCSAPGRAPVPPTPRTMAMPPPVTQPYATLPLDSSTAFWPWSVTLASH